MADTHVRFTVFCITFFTSSGFFNPGLSPSFCLRLRSGRQYSPSLWLLTGSLPGFVLQTTSTSATSLATRDLHIWDGTFSTLTTGFLSWQYQDNPLHLPRTDHIGLSTYPRDLDQVTDTESHSHTSTTTSSHFQVIHPILPSCTLLVRMDHG